MTNKLNVLVCKCFYTYFQKISLAEFQDMEIISFCPPCISHDHHEELENPLLKNIQNYSSNIVLICGGSLCPAFQSVIEGAVYVQIEKQDSCFSHLLGKTMVKNLADQGDYLITESWVKKWKNHLETLGLEREIAQRFYSEVTRKFICISEGPKERVIPELEEFSQYLNLPFSVMEPNYSYIRDLLKHLDEDWKLRKTEHSHLDENYFYCNQPANYEKTCEIIKKLTDTESELEIISTVHENLSMLFSCKIVEYVSASQKNVFQLSEDNYSSFLRERTQHKILDNNSGFLVKIELAGQTEGILHIADFEFPRYMLKYLAFTIDIAGVIGLALSNSRKSQIIQKKKEEMEFINTHDSMTGLFNRRFFDEKIWEFQQTHMENGICVMACDLDGLKQINDTRGHNSGDRAIKATADILMECLRKEDILARVGGDEFVALIPDYAESSVDCLKRRILDNLDKYNQKNNVLKISFSLGFSHGYPTSDALPELIRQADKQMYIVKRINKTAQMKLNLKST